jgi:hypothetical protein
VVREATTVLDAAAPELHGPVIRTAASVIGTRGGESLIVATTAFGYTVTSLLSVHVHFFIEPRGWLRKTLAVVGSPRELVRRVLDRDVLARLEALAPARVELGAMSLRLEQRFGAIANVASAIDLVATLATRARLVDNGRLAEV